MDNIALDYPDYDWLNNKGYPTVKHRTAVLTHGSTPHHRKALE
jgi:ribonuclease HII